MARPKGSQTKIIDPSQYEQIEQMAAVGLTINQMATLLGMDESTLEQRMRTIPEVKQAILKGRSKAIFAVGKSAYQQAISGKIPAMTMFYLKCRAGWKDQTSVEVTGPDGRDIFESFTTMVKRIADDKS